jgi:hypothetical protein
VEEQTLGAKKQFSSSVLLKSGLPCQYVPNRSDRNASNVRDLALVRIFSACSRMEVMTGSEGTNTQVDNTVNYVVLYLEAGTILSISDSKTERRL